MKPTPKVNFLPIFCFTLKSARPDGLCANFHPASSLDTRVTEALGVALLAGMMDQLITIEPRLGRDGKHSDLLLCYETTSLRRFLASLIYTLKKNKAVENGHHKREQLYPAVTP